MNLRGAYLLDKPEVERRGISKKDLVSAKLLGYRKDGSPIWSVGGGSLQTWQETLQTAQVSGTALNTSTTATSILPAHAKYTLPAGIMSIGKTLRVNVRGRMSNIVTTPGNITLDVRFGSVVVFNGGAVALNVVAKTNVTFEFEALLTCQAVGSGTSANMLGIGSLTSESMVGAAANTALTASLPLSAPAAGTGFDSTAAQVVDVFATFSINNASNSIQAHLYSLEMMN